MILHCQVVRYRQGRCFVWGAWGGIGDWGKTGEDWGKGGGPINWRQQIPSRVVIDTVLIVSLW